MNDLRNNIARELYREFNNGRANPGYTPFECISQEQQNGWLAVADNVIANTGLSAVDEPTTGETTLTIRGSSPQQTVTFSDLEPVLLVHDESGD